jgi:hypothetical protein
MKTCIAVLTRGYNDISMYGSLIQRNEAISTFLHDKTVPLLIFHEGNITEEHQTVIRGETPELTMQFIDIKKDGLAFRREKESIPHLRGNQGNDFGIGYRHMCHFWFVDFWHFVEDYDIMIRIDEDCEMESSLDSIIQNMVDSPKNACLWSGKIDEDKDFVCVGMNQFTRDFIGDGASEKYPPCGPYTNFIGMRLDRLRDSGTRLMDYVSAIEKSNGIYLNRWGDLPLWGEAVTYILGHDSLVIDKEIRYYHGSHYTHVNGL